MDARALFSQLEFISGEFPEDVLVDAIDQRESILPLLLEELRRAAADPVGLFDKGESYIRHIYAIYLLAQFREAAAYPLLVILSRHLARLSWNSWEMWSPRIWAACWHHCAMVILSPSND